MGDFTSLSPISSNKFNQFIMKGDNYSVKTKLSLIGFSIIILTLLACNSILPFGGSSKAGLGEVPVYAGATELKAGESNIGDTLKKNEEQNAALSQAMGSLGGGTELEQKGFQLPSEATWDQVKAFYDKDLSAAGWSSGLGGIAGSIVDVNAMISTANEGNDLFKTAIWSKDKETLTLVMVTDPTDATKKQLIMSLSTR